MEIFVMENIRIDTLRIGRKKAPKATKITLFILILLAAVFVYYAAEVMLARAATAATVEACYKSGRIKMTVQDLSPRQLAVLLTIEDPHFYRHHGVDFHTPGAGWTTITQGLAKGFYFENFQQGPMKIKQTLCARFALDPLVDKETQLTLFINLMYFGNGIYGLPDAAAYYFRKPVAGRLELNGDALQWWRQIANGRAADNDDQSTKIVGSRHAPSAMASLLKVITLGVPLRSSPA